jgi:hypothetical protein
MKTAVLSVTLLNGKSFRADITLLRFFDSFSYSSFLILLSLQTKNSTTFSISISVTNLFVCLLYGQFLLPFVFALLPKAALIYLHLLEHFEESLFLILNGSSQLD